MILLVVGLVLIAGTYVFVAAEFSLVTVDRATVTRDAAAGDRRSQSLLAGLRTLSTQLSAAQVGITVTTLALGFVMEPSLASLISPLLTGLGISETAADSISVLIALIVATVLSMVFGELVPKNIAISAPLATAKAVVRPNRAAAVLFKPLIWALNGTANGVLRLFGIEPQEELRSARSPEELESLVRRSAAQGTLDQPSANLLARSISFANRTADDVLTPRPQVRFVRAADSAEAVITASVETGHSRFPVSGEDSDDVVGLVHLKRAVAIPPDERAGVRIEQLMTEVLVVPETQRLEDLLEELRSQGLQMAVVADEYGGTAGILTLEDVVEELVGEIVDEHDPRTRIGDLLPDGTWALPGTLRPDEVAEVTGVRLPEDGNYETVAGLLIDELGRIPSPGDSVAVMATVESVAQLGVAPGHPEDGPVPADPDEDLPRAAMVRLTVLQMDRRRVDTVLLSAVGVLDEADWPEESR
ncbi:hemolysin family protein [Nakamurella alba]|uniref:hemolysin family protein n=1 Tax=Nakamurella alba TaxID=2665158 RepID=UPI001E5F4571|nr:hemolysin family protein [Nakamurella alba]